MDLRLGGRVALVTGSTRGIGKAAALRLAEEGCAVAICGRTKETLTSALAELKAKGARCFGMQVDLMAPGGVESFIDATARELGRLDVVVANAGGTFGGSFLQTEAADWVKTLELNVVLAARTVRAAVPHFERSDVKSVVIVASVSGSKPGSRPQYGVAKAGEILLAAALAKELGPQRIRVNTVSPGSIFWEGGSWHQRSQAMPSRIADFVVREFPWGRMGSLDEVSDVIAFVASPRAMWVNGANVTVDGAQGAPSISFSSTTAPAGQGAR